MDLTVATYNVLHARVPWRPLADLCGWQEADKRSWWEGHAGYSRAFIPALPAGLAVGITWDSRKWKLADPADGPNQGTVMTHRGRRAVTPNRFAAWVILEQDGQRLALVNTHYISGVRGKGKWPVAWRRARWIEHHAALCRLVADLRKEGLPVIVTGDFNRAGRDVHIEPLRRITGPRGIDHIFVSPEFTASEVEYLPRGKSDHAPVRATLTIGAAPTPPKPDPEVPVTDDRYELTTHDGKTVDRYTKAALEECERRLGYDLTIVQGSYNRTVKASARTHFGGGAIDLAPYDYERKLEVLKRVGFAAWYRPRTSSWGPHIHAVMIGNEKADPQAKAQVESYRKGRNGLADDGPDIMPWRPEGWRVFKYPKPLPPSHVALFRRTVEEALAVHWSQIDSDERPHADAMFKAVDAALKAGPKA